MGMKHKMNDTIILKRPASFYREPWRDGTALGNGLTGAVVYGNAGEENIIFNRYDLWHGDKKCTLPDVSESFKQMRELIIKGNYNDAKDIVCDELKSREYVPRAGIPFPLGVLSIKMPEKKAFNKYKRYLHMDTGESEVEYCIGNKRVCQRSFVSRDEDVFVWNTVASGELKFLLTFDMHDDDKGMSVEFRDEIKSTLEIAYTDGYIFLKAKNETKGWYGAAVKVCGAVPLGDKLILNTKEITVLVKCFSGFDKLSNEFMKMKIDEIECDYNRLFARHKREHQKLYMRTDINLFDKNEKAQNMTNEELLDEAYYYKASPQMIEKLWRFGKYLFISGTRIGALPFSQYGLWNGEYEPGWAQYVANENIQMLYWHIMSGNLIELMIPLIKFYCSNIDEYREYAKKIFGCKGIFVSVYSSPINRQPNPVVPVIINCISVAGWLCQHFYKYYKMTGDTDMLEKYIYPFMYEAAEFYLDYVTYDEFGKMQIIPSVSPENSPQNFMEDKNSEFELGHPMPTVKNATIDLAIIKELLTNLIDIKKSENIGSNESSHDIKRWTEALERIPEYIKSDDGGIKEWGCEELKDNYYHRHFSHIYPLYPGDEISDDDALFSAFEKAVDSRKLVSQSGWSLCHMSAIYSVLGRGNSAAECIDNLCKSCVLNNFMTMHNDYRRMGITLNMGYISSVQLDANMGAVNAIQMMLFFSRKDKLYFLHGLSDRLKSGKVRGFAFEGGTTDFVWDIDEGYFEATISANRDVRIKINIPAIFNRCNFECDDVNVKCYEGYYYLEKNKKYILKAKHKEEFAC